MDGVLALMGFPAFLLQVTSHNESSGPCLIPFLLIKMINKSRESHGGIPLLLSKQGWGTWGICIWKSGGWMLLWFQLSNGVLGYTGEDHGGEGGFGHLQHFGLYSTEVGQVHKEKEIHAKALMQSRQEETGMSH